MDLIWRRYCFSIDLTKISKYSAVAILLIGLVNSGQLVATNNPDRIKVTPVEILDHPSTHDFLSKESTDYQVNELKNEVKKVIGEENYHKSLSDIVIEMDSINNDVILWTGSGNRTTVTSDFYQLEVGVQLDEIY